MLYYLALGAFIAVLFATLVPDVIQDEESDTFVGILLVAVILLWPLAVLWALVGLIGIVARLWIGMREDR